MSEREVIKVATSLRRAQIWRSRLQKVEFRFRTNFTSEHETMQTNAMNAEFATIRSQPVSFNERRFIEVINSLNCTARDAESFYWLKDYEHFVATPDSVQKLKEWGLLDCYNHSVLTYHENPNLNLFVEPDIWRKVHDSLKELENKSPVYISPPDTDFLIKLEAGKDPQLETRSWVTPFLLVMSTLTEQEIKDDDETIKNVHELGYAEKFWLEDRVERYDLTSKSIFLLEFSTEYDRNNATRYYECIDILYSELMGRQEAFSKEFFLMVTFDKKRQSNIKLKLVLEKGEDSHFAKSVFEAHEIEVEAQDDQPNVLHLQSFPSHMKTPADCIWLTERICEANTLQGTDIVQINSVTPEPQNPSSLQSRLDQALCSIAELCRVIRPDLVRWDTNGHRMFEIEEMPWVAKNVTRSSDKAEQFFVTFKENDVGEKIILDVISKSLSEDVGAFEEIKPIYKMAFPVNRQVRYACDKIIRELNEKFSIRFVQLMQNGDGVMEQPESTYFRLRIYEKFVPGSQTGIIGVEGWPVSEVQDAVKELKDALKPVEFSAAPELFFGVGEAFAYSLTRKFDHEVLIDVDKYQHLILLIGSAATDAIEELRAYSEKKCSIEVICQIPLFSVNRAELVDKSIGFTRRHLGCDAFVAGDNINFRGSITSFEILTKAITDFSTEVFRKETSDLPASFTSTCTVCHSEIGSQNNYFRPACGHCLCRECANLKISSSIDSSNFKIMCDSEQCKKPWSPEDIIYIVLGGPRRIKTLDSQKLAKLMSRAKQCVLDSTPTAITCPTADCAGILFTSAGLRETRKNCSACGHAYCRECLAPFHDSVSCRRNEGLIEADASIAKFTREAGVQVKNCPKCQEAVTKGPGCNHIECRCGAHFCWVCLFLAKDRSGCYAHMRETHGGFGGEWDFDQDILQIDELLDEFSDDDF